MPMPLSTTASSHSWPSACRELIRTRGGAQRLAQGGGGGGGEMLEVVVGALELGGVALELALGLARAVVRALRLATDVLVQSPGGDGDGQRGSEEGDLDRGRSPPARVV